jgi:hypothetical protein
VLPKPNARMGAEQLVEEAARLLCRLHALGLVRLACGADGRLEAEVLDRVRR